MGIFYGLKIISTQFYRYKNTHKLSKLMQKSALFLCIISFVILSQSCSRQKGYFQQKVVQNYQKADIQTEIKPIEFSQEPTIIKSEPILTSSTVEDFASMNKVSEKVKFKEKMMKLEKVLAENKTITKPQKLNFVQKIILKKVQKKMANKSNSIGFHDWFLS